MSPRVLDPDRVNAPGQCRTSDLLGLWMKIPRDRSVEADNVSRTIDSTSRDFPRIDAVPYRHQEATRTPRVKYSREAVFEGHLGCLFNQVLIAIEVPREVLEARVRQQV